MSLDIPSAFTAEGGCPIHLEPYNNGMRVNVPGGDGWVGREGLVGLVALLIVLNKGVSYLREQGLARVFGAGHDFDAYAMAIAVSGLVFGLVGNSLSTVAIPMIKDAEVKGDGARHRAVSTTLWTSITLLAAGALAQVFLAEPLLNLMAPALPDTVRSEARVLLWALAPTTAMMGFWIVAGSLLNTRDEFALPIYVPVVLDAILLSFVLALGPRVGVGAAAIGFLVGNAVQTLILIRALKARGMAILSPPPPRSAVIAMVRMASPVAVTVLLSQSLQVVDKYYASAMPEGVISCLHYSILITNIPIGIFAVAVGTVLFPHIAGLMARGEGSKARMEARRGLIASVGIGLAGTAAMWFGAETIVGLLFGRGEFGPEAVSVTAGILRFQALSIPTLSAVTVMERAYYSAGLNTRPLMAIGLATAAFVASQALIPHLAPGISGHERIGMGYGVYGLVNALALIPGYGGSFNSGSLDGRWNRKGLSNPGNAGRKNKRRGG